jgi:aspartyl/glutamyl-tRNA(Asn/Gln) amidotransferase C subunit
MSVTPAQLDHLCKLAALNLSPEQKAKFGPQLGSIVGFVSKLESLDLTDIESITSHIVSHMNDGVVQSDFDFLSNIQHPVAGQMPAVSFTTRGD